MPTYDHDMTAMALSPHLNHFIECSDSEQTRFPGTIGRRNGVSRTRTHVKIMKQPTWPLNRHKLLSKAEVLSKKVTIWDTWAKKHQATKKVFWSIKKIFKARKKLNNLKSTFWSVAPVSEVSTAEAKIFAGKREKAVHHRRRWMPKTNFLTIAGV